MKQGALLKQRRGVKNCGSRARASKALETWRPLSASLSSRRHNGVHSLLGGLPTATLLSSFLPFFISQAKSMRLHYTRRDDSCLRSRRRGLCLCLCPPPLASSSTPMTFRTPSRSAGETPFPYHCSAAATAADGRVRRANYPQSEQTECEKTAFARSSGHCRRQQLGSFHQ